MHELILIQNGCALFRLYRTFFCCKFSNRKKEKETKKERKMKEGRKEERKKEKRKERKKTERKRERERKEEKKERKRKKEKRKKERKKERKKKEKKHPDLELVVHADVRASLEGTRYQVVGQVDRLR